MIRAFWLYAAVPLASTAVPATAQSAFDGTWKADVAASSVNAKPNEFAIQNGVYNCTSCLPPFSVKADGAFHAAADKPYWDEIAVEVVDPPTVQYRYRKGGKEVASATLAVAVGSDALSIRTRNINNGGGVPIETTATETRLAAAPAVADQHAADRHADGQGGAGGDLHGVAGRRDAERRMAGSARRLQGIVVAQKQ
jgi:hypothetical protein